MAGAGSGKKGSFVTSCGWTSPEEKLVLVRWAVLAQAIFSCVVLGKGASDPTHRL